MATGSVARYRVGGHHRGLWVCLISCPVILGHDGRVMDGMHRIARALLEGKTDIGAVRFPAPPEPDYRNCQPHELPH